MAQFSPHAWGWTIGGAGASITADVFPTRVGVDLVCGRARTSWRRFPHTRGGGPISVGMAWGRIAFSPHAWGWTYTSYSLIYIYLVFPTRVGVDLPLGGGFSEVVCFPHTRGGGPILTPPDAFDGAFSPHAWGWTVPQKLKGRITFVFPTRVGVDRHFLVRFIF